MPQIREKIWHRIYPYQAASSNFGFCGRKAPLSRMMENFLTLDLSISGNFQQLWILWQKSPPPQNEGNFFDIGSIHFRQFPATLDFVAEKPPQMRENFLTLDLSISGNFQQLWFLWQKSPPPQNEGNFFYIGSIHFRQFPATLDFVAEKPPSPEWGKFFWHRILSISGNFQQLWFLWQKSPPPQNEGNFFYIGSIHFRQFPATLVFVAEPPPQNEGNFFDIGSIHFRQFPGTLVFVAEKPTPLPPKWGKNFWHRIYPFQAISNNFGFCGRKAPPPPMR